MLDKWCISSYIICIEIEKGKDMKTQNHLEIQAQIAKVLASENIDVEFRNIETAAFDPVNRVLIVPQYRDGLSKSMYDLFIGHEVGHALFTPQISPDKVREDLPNFGQFVNVVEDVRIERKIRNRFPGLVKSFVRGYGDLLQRKFFGDFDERPLSGRSLADRLNVFFKVGELNTGLEFFDTELSIKEQIETAETWEDVVAAAEVLYEYAQGEKKLENEQRQEEEGESNDFEQGYGEDTEDGEGTSGNEEESGDGEEERSEERGESTSESEDDVKTEGDQSVPSNGHENGESFEEPSIETQQEFEKRRVNEIGDHNRTTKNVYIDDVNLDDIIIGYSDLYRHLQTAYSNKYDNTQEVVKAMSNRWNKFRSDNNKVVMSSAREFEMRKSADEFKRTKISKTGVIDMNALHKYRFTEDIFLKQAVVKDGKNHSLTMFIDWSGSMGHIISDTISQLQVLALFCKKVNIPFEVYAFTNNFHHRYMHQEMLNHYYTEDVMGRFTAGSRKRPLFKDYGGSFGVNDDYALLNILSSDMSKSDFDTANIWLEYTKNEYTRAYGRYWSEGLDQFAKWFCLGGTPLNETFAILPQLMERNSKKNKSQINNIVFLTDGAGGSCIRYADPKYDNDLSPTYPMDIIIDKKTKHAYQNHSGNIMDVLSKRVKDRVNCNLINFHLVASNPHGVSHAFRDLGVSEYNTMSWDEIKISSRSLKKNGYLILNDSYYDRVFLISDKKISIEETNNMGELVAGQATKAQIKKALLKDTKGNKENRIIMNKFAGMVAA